MGINLQKGARVNLEKEAPGISKVSVGLGWDQRDTSGADFDLDASVFLCDSQGNARGQQDFVYYNNLTALNGAVTHTGDNLTGEGEGDDEVVKVDLTQITEQDADIQKLAFIVTIYDAENRKQNFGQVENAFIRIVNDADGAEIVRYDLTEDYSVETAMIFGELYLKDGQWRFTAVGSGFEGGLSGALKKYGLS
jgi:tellurium resistance protein TerD